MGWLSFFSLHTLSNSGVENEPQEETLTRQQFIDQLAPHAKQLQQGYGVLPSIILGQAILESNWGQSQLASQYKNLSALKLLVISPK
mgnify:CR=1 FL=1